MYLCKSNKKLSDETLRGLAKELNCCVEVLGKSKKIYQYIIGKGFELKDFPILSHYNLNLDS